MSERIEIAVIPNEREKRRLKRRKSNKTLQNEQKKQVDETKQKQTPLEDILRIENDENTNATSNLQTPATPAPSNASGILVSDADSTRTIDTAVDDDILNKNDNEALETKDVSSDNAKGLFTKFMTVASYGAEFLMVDEKGNPIKSVVQVSTDGEEVQTDFCFFELTHDVLILDGTQSKPFKKVENIMPEKLCFSLVNQEKNRSLNFVAKDEQVKQLWVDGFYHLCASKEFKNFQHEFQEFCQS